MSNLPKYCIHILGDEREKIVETLNSIARQRSANVECVLYVSQEISGLTGYTNVSQVVVQREPNMLLYISAKNADFHALVHAGTEYVANCFSAVSDIFQTFSQIDWLCGNVIPKRNNHFLSPQPLYRRIVSKDTYLKNSIDSSSVFLRHQLVEKSAKNAEKTEAEFHSLWQFFFPFSDLYFTSVFVAYSEEVQNSFSWKRWFVWLLKKKLTANRDKRIVRFNHQKSQYFLSEF